MNLVTMNIYCDCKGDPQIMDAPEMELVKEDWHGEQKRFKCPNCGREIYIEFSIVSGEAKKKQSNLFIYGAIKREVRLLIDRFNKYLISNYFSMFMGCVYEHTS